MKRIIFIDDETKVLDGLRRMLYPLRSEWNMTFAESGPEALEKMDQAPFDVVITDIRMPGMDGIELLGHVRARHPEVVRIVLSGQSERDLTLKSAATAHQYLSKPCDAETLKNTLARAFALKNSIEDPSLQALVSGVNSLPSVPALYLRLVRELDRPDSSIQEIANVISQDTAMTAKILQLANSAFFGIRRRITSPKDAVIYLGFDNLKALALSVQIFSTFKMGSKRFSIDRLAHHGMRSGVMARLLAERMKCPRTVVDDAFMAGLLHDVGKLVLVGAFPSRYDEALLIAETTGKPLWKVEREEFGTTHAEVGTYLLWLWGMPDAVVEAVNYHHQPSKCPVANLGALAAVHIGDALEHDADDPDAELAEDLLDGDYLNALALTDQVLLWRKEFAQRRNLQEVV